MRDLRSRLTSNRTLSHISWRYGLAKNLIFKQSGCKLKSAREDEQRLAANAIEAYCGSVVEADRGDESAVAQWLERLLVPQVFPAFERIMKSMQGVPDTRPRLDTGDPVRDAEHRTSSGRRAISERRHHKWTDEFIQGQRWTAALEVRGQVAGVGTASKIAAAREIALDEYLESTLPPLRSPPPTTDAAANPQESLPSRAGPEKDS
ncbi:hypothetical protein RHOSPDRAFT_34136 [Rhodotorula sp. JG-1b]|nr:hypothetical protein RHOSPDRAFT_34136 [Rhodotorula sp. JG-1b]